MKDLQCIMVFVNGKGADPRDRARFRRILKRQGFDSFEPGVYLALAPGPALALILEQAILDAVMPGVMVRTHVFPDKMFSQMKIAIGKRAKT